MEIGKVTKAHGLKGAMRVRSYLESEKVLRKVKKVWIGRERESLDEYRVKTIRPGGRIFLMEVEGIEDADSAAALVGRDVYAGADCLDRLPEDEYYWRDLIGLDVFTEEGERLGAIASIFPTGSNDVYVCRGEKEILLPAISDVIREIDIGKRRMVVRLPREL
ncbi:MAG: ribosome maturation factor RimM [Syntrophales bacterium]|nr:ribosome maturation factor RimM [Syntrophales bacterium]MDD5532478.1 ribosome maturation factor RimM [Syntrophales bacterium]HPL63336.1 ribosome maturation factor RimM [Syntrophales bacterium]